jgi:hypothetical protein
MSKKKAPWHSKGIARSPASVHKSICDVRRFAELPCRGCVLEGTVACPSSGGVGKPTPNLYQLQPPGVFGGRTVEGYKCHVPLNFLYNSNS